MARRLNKKTVVALTFVGMVVLFVVWIVLIFNVPRDPAWHVQHAEDAVRRAEEAADPAQRAEDWKNAAMYYARAHKAAGKNTPEALGYLVKAGQMHYLSGDARRAIGAWQLAIEIDPSFKDAYVQLIGLYLELFGLSPDVGYLPMIQKCAEGLHRVLAEHEAESDARSMSLARYARGMALLGKPDQSEENIEQGVSDLKAAIKGDPGNPDYTLRLARHYERLAQLASAQGPEAQEAAEKHLNDAEGLYRECLAAREQQLAELKRQAESPEQKPPGPQAPDLTAALSDSAKAHRYYAQFLLGQRKASEAIAQLRKAAELAPEDVDVQTTLGQYWMAQNNSGKARAAYEEAIKLDPDRHIAYQGLAELHMRADEPARALDVCKARLVRPLDRSSYRELRHRFGHFQLLLQAAQATLALAVRPDANKDELLAQAEQYVAEAEYEVGKNGLTHLWRGRILAQRDRSREAIRELEDAAKLLEGRGGPAIERARLQSYLSLAELYTKLGELGSARTNVLKALETAPGHVPGILLLARLENSRDDPEQALLRAQQAYQLAAGVAESELARELQRDSLRIQIDACRKLGQLVRVRALGEQLVQLEAPDADAVRAHLERGRVLGLAEDFEGAEAEFRKVLQREPANITAVRWLVYVLTKDNRTAEIKDMLQRARQADPDSQTLKALLLATELADDPDERDRQIRKLIEEEKDELTRAMQLYLYCFRRQQWEQAKQHLDAAERLKPGDSSIIERQFNLALIMKDYARAEQYVTKAAEGNLDSAGGKLYRGRLQMAKNEPQEAVRVLREALSEYGGDSKTYVILGNALLMTSNYEAAQSAFEEAISRNPNSGAANAGLARLAFLKGDEDTKRRHLLQCRRLRFQDAWVRQQLELEQEQQYPEVAIQRREKLREEQPDDVQNLLRLARLYQRVNKSANTDECLKRAVSLAPDDLSVVWRCAQIHAALGNPSHVQLGEKLLSDFIRRSEDASVKARAWAALAQYYRGVGRDEQVEAAYKEAARASADAGICAEIAGWYGLTGRFEEALSWYEKAVEAAADRDVKRWIRRRFVEFLLERGDPEIARPVVEAFAADYPQESMRLLFKGELELQLGREEEALKDLNSFIDQNSNQAVGYFRRGYLHFLRSLWQPAIDDLRRAKSLSLTGFNYQHRALLARVLELSGKPDEAVGELEEILEADPDATGVARTLLRTFQRLKRYQDAEDLARRMTFRQPEDAYWPLELGRAFLRGDERGKAIGPLRKAVQLSDYSPAAVATLLDGYLRLGMPQRVFEFVEKELPPERRDATVHGRMARAHKMAGDLGAAFKNYDLAVSQTEGSPWASYKLVKNMIGIMGTSLSEYVQQRLAKEPEHRVWRLCRAELLAAAGKSNEARAIQESLLQGAQTDDEKAVSLLVLAMGEHQAGHHEAAQRHYEQYIKLRPNDAVALNNLAYMLADGLKKPELAEPYARQAVRQNPVPPILDTLGWIYTLLGDYDRAVAALRRAVNLDPEMPLLHYHLAEAYMGRQDKASAVRELNRARELLAKDDRPAQDSQKRAELDRKIDEALQKLGVSP